MAKKRSRQKVVLGKGGAPVKGAKVGGGGFSLAGLSFLLPQLSAPTQPLWRLLPWLLALGFVLRAVVALYGDFVIHPDEIMQYLEPAHGVVFGNTVAYWEFYYGARSWLIPSFVAAVMFLCKVVGLGEPTFYVAAVKLFFCALSLFVPLGLYVFGRRLFGEQTGRVALLLGVFWYELVGFAHKPMSEFVATSLLMALMVYALRPERLSARQAALATVFGVFIVATRFQYAPIAGFVLLVPFIRADNGQRLVMIGAAAGALVALGVFEYVTWGGLFHSYWLNLQANFVLNQYRGEESSALYFVGWPIVASGGLFLLAFASMLNYRRRLFLLLLVLIVVLPHMTQAHREYRFIYITVPVLLLLFADLLVCGWEEHRKSVSAAAVARWRQVAGLAAALVVSAGGIANALPLQYWVYEASSRETGYVHFFFNQDEIFSMYRQLAADESVRGVHDLTRPYFNGGGYYYLHHSVPFYSGINGGYPLTRAKDYVSHVIAPPAVTPAGVAQTAGGRLVMQTEGGALLPLPGVVSDESLGKLVYWDERAQATVIEGFALEQAGEKLSLWKAVEDAPVRGWRRYQVAPDSAAMHPVVEQAISDGRPPAKNLGIEFAEEGEGGAAGADGDSAQ